MKKSCILIQCYVKPEETKQVLHTIERCSEINEYTLVLYVDSAPDHSKFKSPNQQLIESLLEYKNQKINRFKDIIVKIADQLGALFVLRSGFELLLEHFDQYGIFWCPDNDNPCSLIVSARKMD
jgi:hypothetical protein